MYVIVTASYPNDKVKEVADMYIKAITKYPPDDSLATPVVPVAVRATLQGIRVIGVHEIKKGKLEAAMARMSTIQTMFYGIQGYRWTMKTYLNLEEAMNTLGG